MENGIIVGAIAGFFVAWLIGVAKTDYTHLRDDWSFEGLTQPTSEAASKLRLCCRQVFELFNCPPGSPAL